jgi:hypothetical protein
MKKIVLYISFLVLFVCIGCPPSSVRHPVKEITYEAITKGRSETINIKSNIRLLIYKTHQTSKEIPLSSKQLKALYKAIKTIEYTKTDKLKAPSDKRFYDGAMAASITFVASDKKYQSITFDDDNPPSELKELVLLLKSFVA